MYDHAWLRLLPLWYGVFYVMLVFTTTLTLMEASRSSGSSAMILGFSLLLGLWYGLCMFPLSRRLRQSPLLSLGYLALGWGLWFWLTMLDPLFMFLLFGLYPQVFFFRSMPWKIFDAVLLTFLSLWRQVLLLKGLSGSLFLTIAATICGILMTFFIEAIIRQSLERHRLLHELEMTRHELAVAERQAGVTDERQRLAREIHDTLVQGFTSIVMHLEAAEGVLLSDNAMLQRYLDQARRTARENLIEARRLMWALQPQAFDHASLSEVLTRLTCSWSEENKIAANATITGVARSLRPEIEVTLLRAAQETLANASKHARASLVTVTLSYMEDEIVLDVQDNGRGFDMEHLPASPTGEAANSFGLKALRERVAQLSGTLSIESAPGEGTTIAVALPAVCNEPFLCSDVVLEKEIRP
jgi:signal transduction histidine kinase